MTSNMCKLARHNETQGLYKPSTMRVKSIPDSYKIQQYHMTPKEPNQRMTMGQAELAEVIPEKMGHGFFW